MDHSTKTKEELIEIIKKQDIIIEEITKNCRHMTEGKEKDNEILDQVISLNPYAIAIWSRDGYFVKANKAYINMFLGHPPEDYSIWNDPGLKKKGTWEHLMDLRKGNIMHALPMWYNARDMKPEYPDNLICFKTIAFPVYNSSEKEPDYYVFMYDDVTFEMKILEENTRQKKSIEESNITLRNLIHHLEEEKNSIKENIALNIENLIKPVLNNLEMKFPEKKIFTESLRKNLDSLTESFYKKMITMKYDLTPTEIRICELVKNGYSNKEIAQILYISIATVQTHKKNIRKKLNLSGTKTNLRIFLMSV